jgi:DNA repair protein RecN (Recombination protein N)
LRLEQRLIEELKPLAMDNVQFQVLIEPVAPTSTGSDRIIFLFSPNPGEPLQPVAEIASGGEMSRFLLALQSCFVQVDSAATLVFDEIDAGVSGRVAGAIAQKLHQLSQGQQVLFVTHQPIVAAMADFHFRVNKQVIDTSEETPEATGPDPKPNQSPGNGSSPPGPMGPEERTVVRVTALDREQRREELAQLAGGQGASEAIAWAQSLLNQAASVREIQTRSS